MEKFLIEGKHPISGIIEPQGNKNEALPLLCASILNPKGCTISNVPNIQDISTLMKILEHLGVKITQQEESTNTYHFNTSDLSYVDLPENLVTHLRGSVTLMAPLLVRFGKVFLPRPGGDKIGRRRIDTHLLALTALGAKVDVRHNGYYIEASELIGANILLDEMSVTGTENALMAAAGAKGISIIENAASEPHVQGLCRFLVNQGVEIQGIGSNRLVIQGIETYKNLREAKHQIGPDYLEIGSFIAISALTNGELTINNIRPEEMRMIDFMFRKLGIHIEYEGTKLFLPKNQILEINSEVHDQIPKIDDSPWPGFPADLISIALVIASQCKGTILIHQKLFESRLFFTDKLIGMGAKIVLCDPHRAMVIGPSNLYSSVLTSPDIRAGMALLIAALCAEGTSVIHNIYQIDRGYENIDTRLRTLGACIKREKE